MNDATIHINPSNAPEFSESLTLFGLAAMMQKKEEEIRQLKQEVEQYKEQVEFQSQPQKSIIAEGKQNEIIAALNVLFEAGLITDCTKAEYMRRAADFLGAPGIAANFSKALYNYKLTYKYDETFQKLNEVALAEKKK